jgi:DNA modification methylase
VSGGFAVVNFNDIVSGREAAQSDDVCEFPMAVEYWPAFRAAGWSLWTRRIWQKPHARVHSPWAIKSCRAASDWEHLWVWKKAGKPIAARGQFSAFGVWDTSQEHGVDIGKEQHGAGMAVSLATRGIETHSRPGQAVFEPFSGTGTTIVAAEMTGRSCRAIELNPQYVDVAIRRWQAFSGQSATLHGTGRTFADMEAERMALAG